MTAEISIWLHLPVSAIASRRRRCLLTARPLSPEASQRNVCVCVGWGGGCDNTSLLWTQLSLIITTVGGEHAPRLQPDWFAAWRVSLRPPCDKKHNLATGWRETAATWIKAAWWRNRKEKTHYLLLLFWMRDVQRTNTSAILLNGAKPDLGILGARR